MTSTRAPASTLLLDPADLAPARPPSARVWQRRGHRPAPAGRGYAPSCPNPTAVGRLVITRLDGAAAPASIASVAVHDARSDGAAPTVLRYHHAGRTDRRSRGYWAVTAETVLGRAALSGRSSLRGGVPAAASTTGS